LLDATTTKFTTPRFALLLSASTHYGSPEP
jgi:hypothetical protein